MFYKSFLSTYDLVLKVIFKPGVRPARAWFLKIAFVWEVSMCVCVWMCVSAPEAMNN